MTPDEHTIAEHTLDVGHGHSLYIQDWGNKKSRTPIIHLHGGPGSHTKDSHKRPYDPVSQRVIFFDQRGCGHSTPTGKMEYNNTSELASDITKIADLLSIDRFILSGHSWGSCLALFYAIQQPRRVAALVISGVFTGSQAEIDWLDKGRFRTHFPEAWDRYLAVTPHEYHDDPGDYHFARAFGNDAAAAAASIHAYNELELAALKLDDTFTPIPTEEYDPTGTKLEMRYLSKRCFMPDRFILKNARKLKLPVYIVQGRYDFVCPPAVAYELSKLIPNAHITWTIAGHAREHETINALRLIFHALTTR